MSMTSKAKHLGSSPFFAASHGLETEREEIDKLREKFQQLPNKTPDDHQVGLEFFDHLSEDKKHRRRRYKFAKLTLESGAKNALSGRMICQLTERLDLIERWLEEAFELEEQESGWAETDASGQCSGRALLIEGAGGTFCSGSDLVGVRASADHLSGLELSRLMQYNCSRLEQLPVISVAHLQGYAVGGGAELAMAADLRLMSPQARIGFVHARNGICCGWGGGVRLVELVGKARALELLASGRLLGAQEALSWGLANALTTVGPNNESGQAHPRQVVLEFLAEHSIGSLRTCRAVKASALAAASTRTGRSQALWVERQCFGSTWGRQAHLETLEANLKHNLASLAERRTGGANNNNNNSNSNSNSNNSNDDGGGAGDN